MFNIIGRRAGRATYFWCLIHVKFSTPIRRLHSFGKPTAGSIEECMSTTLLRSEQFYSFSAHRFSSSDVYQHLHKDFRLENQASAQELVNHFLPEERALLLKILSEEKNLPETSINKLARTRPSFNQLKQLFIINTIPFIGFGILDNMIMLLAGEYIDQTLGALLGISTMAAAALGNIISDVAGVGLAHYVELLVARLGFQQPELTPRQLDSRRVRLTVNLARAYGLVVGCFIGMFPLLFFKSEKTE